MSHRRPRAFVVFHAALLVFSVLLPAISACGPPRSSGPVRLAPIPMRDAIEIVNRNTAKITGTLRAAGPVDGTYSGPDGRRRNYHLDGTLFYLAPRHFRFDLKRFGDRQMLLGSNEDRFWCYNREDDSYFCGRHDAVEDFPGALPARPDQIIDALGLSRISGDDAPPAGGPGSIQRVVEDYQEILFIEEDPAGKLALRKECWLDRCDLRLIRYVVFRDADGIIEMESKLSDYQPLAPGGPMLPHRIEAAWPKDGATMRLNVRKWAMEPQVGPAAVQFATPRECMDQTD